jgi:Fe-S-cluster containining protein
MPMAKSSRLKKSEIETKEVDKEDSNTWKKYTKNSCKTCVATCCTMPIEVRWEDLVKLNLVAEIDLVDPLKVIVARLKKEKVITDYREKSGLFAMKQTSKGKCRYLVDNKCSVYEKRPLVCRNFPTRAGWRHGFCPQTLK